MQAEIEMSHPSHGVECYECLRHWSTADRQRQYEPRSVQNNIGKRLLPQLNNGPAEKVSFWLRTTELIFMHDGAPCHKGRSFTQFLAEHEIETLPWP